jgi:hypothetical protein
MRRLALVLFVAAASCGSALGDPNPTPTPPATTTPLPAWTDADCHMFNPTACRLDLAKTSVAIDVNYPNTFFCRLQLLPTRDTFATPVYTLLASSWQVTLGNAPNDQTPVGPEMPQRVLEYPLGSEPLYLTRVTFTSKTSDTIAALVGNALGPDVSLYAVPLECPGRRSSP